MDPELKEYLDERFERFELTTAIITAGFAFMSMGLSFVLFRTTLYFYNAEPWSEFWSVYELAGFLLVGVGYLFYLKSDRIAEKDLRRRKKN